MTASQPNKMAQTILEIMVRHTREAISVIDKDGKVVFLNDKAAEILRGKPEDFAGRTLDEFLPQDMARERLATMREVLETRQAFEITTPVNMHGETHWFQSRLEPFADEQGNYTLVVGLARDITEFQHTQKELLESEQNYRLITEHMGESIWMLDMNQELVYLSPSSKRVFGFNDENYSMQAVRNTITPESAEAAGRSLQRKLSAANLANPLVKINLKVETEHNCPDNKTRWMENNVVVLRDEQGGPMGILGVARDITDRRQVEQSIRDIEDGLTYRIGEKFLETISIHICRTLHSDFTLIGKLSANKQRVETVVLCQNGEILNNISYDLAGTPCENVSGKQPYAIPRDAQKLFPQDQELKNFDIEGYAGLPLFNSLGQPSGIMAAMYRKPIESPERILSVLQIFAGRVSAEMERQRAEDDLRASESRLRSIVNAAPFGAHLYQLGEDGTLTFMGANQSADEILNISHEPLIGKTIEQAFPPLAETSIPEDYRRVVRSGKSFRREEISYEDDKISGAFEVHALQIGPNQMAAFFRDISERKKADEQIQRHIRRISALRQIDAMISANLDLPINLNALLDHVLRELEVDAAQIMLYNPSVFILDVVARKGFTHPVARTNQRNVSHAFAGRAILERKTISVFDLPTQPERDTIISPADDAGYQSYMAIPLIAKGEVKGVMEIFTKSRLLPDDEWLNFLETLAGQAAIAIDNVTLFRNLQYANRDLSQAYDTTLEGWSRALELRDQETEGHTQRVTELTMRLAQALNVPEPDLAQIRRGALLHDIGKMGIPDSILHKTEPLTDDEWEVIKQHPITAYNLLNRITFLKFALDIPFCHHEKWDGSGYPRGLKGEEIPLSARIFTIIDVWDAITNDRIYRAAWPKQKALHYMRSQSGKYFDPRILEVFLRLVNTGSLDKTLVT